MSHLAAPAAAASLASVACLALVASTAPAAYATITQFTDLTAYNAASGPQTVITFAELGAPDGFPLTSEYSSVYQGSLYTAWTHPIVGPSPDPIHASRSTDGGEHWSSPAVDISAGVAAGAVNSGVNLQTAPNGTVYAVWAIYDGLPFFETALGFNRSTNGGAGWETAQRIITNIRGIRTAVGSGGLGGGKTMRTASFPSMTVDPSGSIYVVWANYGVPGVNAGDVDIWMIKSTNDGNSWSTPTRVNQDASGNGRDQWFPWIAADPVTGNVVCISYLCGVRCHRKRYRVNCRLTHLGNVFRSASRTIRANVCW